MEKLKRKPSNKIAKEQGLKHIPFTFENDDTPKQLLLEAATLLLKNQMIGLKTKG
jgi:hypothetical protein